LIAVSLRAPDDRPWGLELGDSEVAVLHTTDDGWTLDLSVAALRPLRASLGVGDETLLWPGVRLRGLTPPVAPVGALAPGRLQVLTLTGPGAAGTRLPWASRQDGPWRLHLGAAGEVVDLTAQTLLIELNADSAPHPSWAC
jgi:hypothetical protein